jgi:hypothetical protein
MTFKEFVESKKDSIFANKDIRPEAKSVWVSCDLTKISPNGDLLKDKILLTANEGELPYRFGPDFEENEKHSFSGIPVVACIMFNRPEDGISDLETAEPIRVFKRGA